MRPVCVCGSRKFVLSSVKRLLYCKQCKRLLPDEYQRMFNGKGLPHVS